VARRHAPRPEAALLHFKLLGDFREALEALPDLDFRYPGSRRYRGFASLVEAGLVARLPW
jgi:hypothetical protein